MNFLSKIPTPFLVAVLFVLSFCVRVLHITSTDITGDEPFSIFMAQADISAIIKHLSTGNNPPLYEILLHYYMLCFGDSDFILRLLPTSLSALTVIPIFLIGERFFNRKVALVACFLFIFSIFHIRFAHEIRVYSLFCLATAWTLYFFLSITRRPTKSLAWVGLCLCNVILLYSHFTSFYLLLVQGIGFALFIPIAHWKRASVLVLATGILYAPYAAIFLSRLDDVASNGTWVHIPSWGEYHGMINLMLNAHYRIVFMLVVASPLLGVMALGKKELEKVIGSFCKNTNGKIVLIWFLVPYTMMFLVSKFYMPMFIDRYVLFTSIPMFIAIGWVVDTVWANPHFRWHAGILIVIASVLTTDFNPPNNREIGSTVAYVKELNDDDTQVYFCPDFFDLTFAYHYNRNWFRMLGTPFVETPKSAVDSVLRLNGIFPIQNAGQLDMKTTNRIIYLDAASEFSSPENGILNALQLEMNLVKSVHFPEIFDVYLFERGALKKTYPEKL